MVIQENVSLKKLNTFAIDVLAKYLALVDTTEELQSLLLQPQWRKTTKLILGGGSNILFTDNFNGLVIKINILGKKVVTEDEEFVWLQVGAGENWHHLVMFCIAQGYAGIENLSLIPGNIGAAPIQNIGAYGVELQQVFDSLTAVNLNTGKIKTFTTEECCFGYRDSVFKNTLKDKYAITSVTLKLNKTPQFDIEYGAIQTTLMDMGIKELSIEAISKAVIKIRQEKLPDPMQIGNAGSFFKNPEVDKQTLGRIQSSYPSLPYFMTDINLYKIPAGWLIEQCGFKGIRHGDIGVYDKQALVIVNYGDGTGHAILALAKEICSSVYDKFGIELVNEVNII